MIFSCWLMARKRIETILSEGSTLCTPTSIWPTSKVKLPMAFLDLTIYKDENFSNTGLLSTSVYQKPINKFLYIPWRSYHSSLLKKAFIRGLLVSYLRNCSSELSFLKIRKSFFHKLRDRGYPSWFLLPLFEAATYDPVKRRLLLSEIKPCGNSNPTMPLTFKMTASPAVEHLRVRDYISKCKRSLSALPGWDKNLPFRLCLRRPLTIAQIVTRSKLQAPWSSRGPSYKLHAP